MTSLILSAGDYAGGIKSGGIKSRGIMPVSLRDYDWHQSVMVQLYILNVVRCTSVLSGEGGSVTEQHCQFISLA